MDQTHSEFCPEVSQMLALRGAIAAKIQASAHLGASPLRLVVFQTSVLLAVWEVGPQVDIQSRRRIEKIDLGFPAHLAVHYLVLVVTYSRRALAI
jgi:hypothetical protein